MTDEKKKKKYKNAKKSQTPAQKLERELAIMDGWQEYLDQASEDEHDLLKKSKQPVGRPTDYDPIFCEVLIEHCKKGLSFEAFGGLIGMDVTTLYKWAKKHPEFNHAKKIGKAYSRLQWEKIGAMGAKGQLPGFSAAAYIFNKKNRFNWKDKHDITSGGKPIDAAPRVVITLPANGREKK